MQKTADEEELELPAFRVYNKLFKINQIIINIVIQLFSGFLVPAFRVLYKKFHEIYNCKKDCVQFFLKCTLSGSTTFFALHQ